MSLNPNAPMMKTDLQPTPKQTILLVGAGGREHAIAWKLAQSPRLGKLFIAPGNPGTAEAGTNVPIPVEDIPALVSFARKQSIWLVIVGPEAPLALGLVDKLLAAGIPAFGPSRAASQIETSKVFAKAFMQRHGIPTAAYAAFSNYKEALAYLERVDTPVVIKASGLAAGKGVLLPDTPAEARQALYDLMVARSMGSAGDEVVIEERLEGEEISLLAFTDGTTVRTMPPAQDHKRLLEDDRGPNTGGMGAYAPAPACPPALVEELTRSVLQPAVDGLRAEGMRYQGVLYAGLMLTPRGPKVLEFNCRFGDPETQALLPLLQSDLVEIARACVSGTLDQVAVRWQPGSCACVVLTSPGYPASSTAGLPIQGLGVPLENGAIFQAATRLDHERIVTDGGRVLGVSAWADDLPTALERAQAAAAGIQFEGRHYRRDIGARGLRQLQAAASAYHQAGVSIDAGNRAVSLMSAAVRTTYSERVLGGIGAFGGLYDASELKAMQRPVLVASTDGIGTKVMLAAQVGRFASLGQDIVNHCINDILVQGARPLFFLDYFATSQLQPERVAEIVGGMAAACRAADCVLIGGETAEMPGVYRPDEFDVAGTVIGLVEFDHILPKSTLQAGDVLLGLPSSGPHTNGFSLLRKIFADTPLDSVLPGLDRPLADVLLEPHRSYLPWLGALLADPAGPVKALAHITGGGLLENIPRILPPHLDACLRRGSWPVPPLYPIVQQMGAISEAEMARVFNLGIGMLVVVAPQDLASVQQALPVAWVVGELAAGSRKVILA